MRKLALTCKNAANRDCPVLLAVAQFGQIVPGFTTGKEPPQLGHRRTTAVDSATVLTAGFGLVSTLIWNTSGRL